MDPIHTVDNAFDNQIPWTTTRCNRLLRPIASRLVVLRKHTEDRRVFLSKASNHEIDIRANPVAQTEKRVNISQASKDVRPRGFDKTQDPDWMPKPKQAGMSKRIYKGKYSRAKTAVDSSSPSALGRPGDVFLPTPYIARSLGKLQESPHILVSPLQRVGRPKPKMIKPKEELQSMKKQMTPDMWKQIDGLYDGFSNLLQATKSQTDKTRKGSRSLLSMCLRQVPEYIHLEEHFLKEDGIDDDTDIANEIYTHLEDHGAARDGSGWKSLREVVRAHAVSLLRGVIEDRILMPGMVLGLYRLCMNASAWNEAEEFLSSYVFFQGRMALPKDLRSDLFGLDQSSCWSTVNEFVTRTGRYQFLFNQLRLALSQELLPIEWLATQGMRPLWTRIVRILSEGDHRDFAAAFALLESAVIAGIGSKDLPVVLTDLLACSSRYCAQSKSSTKPELQDALSNTFSSLFTLLASIASVSQHQKGDIDRGTVHSATWALVGITTSILTDVNIGITACSGNGNNVQRTLYAITAPFLLRIGGINLGSGFIDIDVDEQIRVLDRLCSAISLESPNTATTPETLPHLVCSLARCFGRASQDDGFDQLQKLVRFLVDPPRQLSIKSKWFTKKVALAASLKFAEGNKNGTHAAFAQGIERIVQKAGPILLEHTPAKMRPSPSRTKRQGFRWEEGICEWVACTPFTNLQVQRATRMPDIASTFPPTPTNAKSELDTRLSQDCNNDVDTMPPFTSSAVPSSRSSSLRPSPMSSPEVSQMSNMVAKDPSTSGSEKRIHGSSLPTSKRRRTDSFGHTGPMVSGSSDISLSRANSHHLSSRRISGHSSANRKRRSLDQIADIVTQLKTRRLQIQVSNGLDTTVREEELGPEPSSDQDDTWNKNNAPDRTHPTQITSQLKRLHRHSTSDARASDMEHSEVDELSILDIREPKTSNAASRTARGGNLRRTIPGRSALQRIDYWAEKGVDWDESEDELNLG